MQRLLAAAVMAAVLPTAAAAGAEDNGGETLVEYSGNTLIVTAGAPGTLRVTDDPGRGGRGPTVRCGWFEIVLGSTPVLSIVNAVDPMEGEFYLLNCWSERFEEPLASYPIAAAYPGRGIIPGPAVSTAEAARYAVSQINFVPPVVVLSPPDRQVVGVPSWLAVTSQLSYAAVSAEAGPVWATVRPEFAEVRWHMGDGALVRCSHGVDVVWHPDRAIPSPCTHVYETSGDGPFGAHAEARWVIHQLTDKSDGVWEEWGTVAITTPFEVDVVELQAAIR